MTELAIKTYEKVPNLGDTEACLNLAWTLDERGFLARDVFAIVADELEAEQASGLAFTGRYFVDDPYGDALLNETVAAAFGRSAWDCEVACGSGVNSLLHGLATLVARSTCVVLGEVYPDFPHWVERLGGRCVAVQKAEQLSVAALEKVHPTVILLERPAPLGSTLDLKEVAAICQRAEAVDALVVVDESYANYCPLAFSAVNIVPENARLAVLRGFSKALWMGGLRCAFCVASGDSAARVKGALPPMMCSSLSLRIAQRLLQLGDLSGPLRRRVAYGRSTALELLSAAGMSVVESSPLVPHVYVAGDGTTTQLETYGILGKRYTAWGGGQFVPRGSDQALCPAV